MASLRLALDSGASWWLLLGLAALAAGAVILFYRRAAPSTRRTPLVFMIGLRVALLLVVLAALFRPSLGYQTGRKDKAVLLALLDRSRSMSISDAQGLPRRFDRARGALASAGGELSREFDLRVWVFDSAARKLAGERELSEEAPSGEATDLVAALDAAKAELGGERLAGAILLTDGIDNSGRDPVAGAARLGFPVYPVGVGSRLSEGEDFKDVAVISAEPPRYAAADNVCEVRAFVDASGFRGREVPVSLFVEDGQGEPEKCRRDLVLDGRCGGQEVRLQFTPGRAGTFKARAVARFDPAERIAENNVQEFLLTVTEPRIRVLYVEGRVRREYGMLRRNWELDPSVEVTGRCRVRAEVFMEHTSAGGGSAAAASGVFPDSLESARRFNVFVLGDIERASFSDAQVETMRRAVSEGSGLLCLSGQASFGAGGWAGTPLAEVLPADIAPTGWREASFPLELTAAGRAHPVFTGCTEFFAAADAARLPRLEFLNLVGPAKPGAEVLAVAGGLEDSSGRAPTVLALQRYGKGRTAIFAAGPTWKWEMLRGQGRDTPYAKFWGQLVRWLAGEEAKRRSEGPGLSAHIDKNIYQPLEKVRIWAEAHGEAGRLAPGARVEARVRGPSGPAGRVGLGPVAESPGQFEGVWSPPAPGGYTLQVSAVEAGRQLGAVELEFRVGKPNLEFERLDLDDRTLRRVAEATRGRYFDLAILDELVGSLVGEVRSTRVGREVRLYPDTTFKGALVALAFLLAAGAEWLMRKRLQLS